MGLWYIGLLSCLVGFSMIYLGGKWAAKGKGGRSSACRRPTVGKKLVKRVMFHPFDRSVWKKHNFYEKSPFCHGVDLGKDGFSPFCREKC